MGDTVTMPMNPYQGLKQVWVQWLPLLKRSVVTMPMNPYQGLKLQEKYQGRTAQQRHNANESLSGIETQ